MSVWPASGQQTNSKLLDRVLYDQILPQVPCFVEVPGWERGSMLQAAMKLFLEEMPGAQ